MKPQKIKIDPQLGLFKMELLRIINPGHPLAQLTKQINWAMFDEKFDSHFSDDGRPAIPTRLMVALHYLKYTHNLSGDETAARRIENPYWQHFSGRQHFEHRLPIDPSSMARWRKRMGAKGAETLLNETIATAVKQNYLKHSHCQKASVDTAVQAKDARFPAGARLYDRMRERLVISAAAEDVELRQNYSRIGKVILRRQQNYAHAKQGQRAAR